MLTDVTTEEICEALDTFRVPTTRAYPLDMVHEDHQVQPSGTLIEPTHPVAGPMRYPRPLFPFEEPPTFPRQHAPVLGVHTRAIISQFGILDTEARLLEAHDVSNREVLRRMLTEAARAAAANANGGEQA